jgi:hypothetical protein
MRAALLVAATVALAVTGCGSSKSTTDVGAQLAPASDVALSGNGAEQRLTVHVGDRFHLTVPAGADVSELGVHELADQGGDVYKAVGVGTATLEVTRRPSCAPGQVCSNLIQLVGTVRVTIRA